MSSPQAIAASRKTPEDNLNSDQHSSSLHQQVWDRHDHGIKTNRPSESRLHGKRPEGIRPQTKRRTHAIDGKKAARVAELLSRTAQSISPLSGDQITAADVHFSAGSCPPTDPTPCLGIKEAPALVGESTPASWATAHPVDHESEQSTSWAVDGLGMSNHVTGNDPHEPQALPSCPPWLRPSPTASGGAWSYRPLRGQIEGLPSLVDYTPIHDQTQLIMVGLDRISQYGWPSEEQPPAGSLPVWPLAPGQVVPSAPSNTQGFIDPWHSSPLMEKEREQTPVEDFGPMTEPSLVPATLPPDVAWPSAAGPGLTAYTPRLSENQAFTPPRIPCNSSGEFGFLLPQSNFHPETSIGHFLDGAASFDFLNPAKTQPGFWLPESTSNEPLSTITSSNSFPLWQNPGVQPSTQGTFAEANHAAAITAKEVYDAPLKGEYNGLFKHEPDGMGMMQLDGLDAPRFKRERLSPVYAQPYDDDQVLYSLDAKTARAASDPTQHDHIRLGDIVRSCGLSRSLSEETQASMSKIKDLRPRKHFNEEDRQATSRTRDVGACVRCKIQRIRCKPNPADLDGPCIGCLKILHSRSKKVIHHVSCLRYKLQEIGLFRTCGLRFTTRWTGAEIRDIPSDRPIVTLCIDQGSDVSLKIQVRKFKPDRRVDDDAVVKCPWALVSAHATKDSYRYFIATQKLLAYRKAIDRMCQGGEVDRFVGQVYRMALEHYQKLCSLDTSPRRNLYASEWKGRPADVTEKEFMEGVFELWFALRQPTGTSKIIGIEGCAGNTESAQLIGEEDTPKMAVCQLNSISIAGVLRPLSRAILKIMMAWISDRKHQNWLSIFYASFILMREISFTTQDAYDHNRIEDPNKHPKFATHIADIQESGNIIQAHWHYFNCSTNPMKLDDKGRGKSPLSKLNEGQFEDIKALWRRAQDLRPISFSEGRNKWCRPMYFAAQMFESDWRPLETYTT